MEEVLKVLENPSLAFLALLKAGLWEEEVRFASFGDVNCSEIYRLAREQSVVGLVAAGLEHLASGKVPQELALNLAGEVLQLEQRNTAMNQFVAQTVERMRSNGIYTLLVKGQGIAQCYERPQWRSSGDIDFFLSEDNYKKAEDFLSELATNVSGKESYSQHLAMTIGAWVVELHGTLRSGLWRTMDRTLDEVQYDIICGGNVRTWMNGNTQVFIPRADEDVVYVFSHILEHFFKEGIGLRQICDWCRLLWTYKEILNLRLLESRLKKMGVMTEWKAFFNLASRYLDMPDLDTSFMCRDSRFDKKADRIMAFVLETGNFGHNRDYSYQKKYPYVVFKAISMWKHLVDGCRFLMVFPLDAIKVTWRRMCVGFAVVIKGKRHE